MKKILCITLMIVAMASCGGGKATQSASQLDSGKVVTDSFVTIDGPWLKSAGDTVRGFVLRADKTAEEVNMPNVKMRRWNLVGDSLKIEATMSVGDSAVRRELGFRVESLRNDTLTLIAGDSFTYYVRKH